MKTIVDRSMLLRSSEITVGSVIMEKICESTSLHIGLSLLLSSFVGGLGVFYASSLSGSCMVVRSGFLRLVVVDCPASLIAVPRSGEFEPK